MAKLSAIPTYQGIVTALGNRNSRRIGNNTTAIRVDDNTVGIRLHNTVIVELTADSILIDTGGWETVTTRERINQFLPNRYGITQTKWIWYVVDRHDNFREIPYYDGMMFYKGVLVHRENGVPQPA